MRDGRRVACRSTGAATASRSRPPIRKARPPAYEFDAGWYVAATSTETPDGLEIALDKDTYAAGEVAKLKVSPRFAGELLVTVGADRLLSTVTATMPADGGTIDIPVTRRLGRRRLCHGHALPARRRRRNRACRRAPSA